MAEAKREEERGQEGEVIRDGERHRNRQGKVCLERDDEMGNRNAVKEGPGERRSGDQLVCAGYETGFEPLDVCVCEWCHSEFV